MDIGIRSARLEDLEQIYRIEIESFKIPYPLEYLYLLLSLAGDLFIVAVRCNEIVGYAVGLLRIDNTGHIVSIAVANKYRGRGIGKRLLQELERRLKDKGAKRFRLEVRVSNRIAINLYLKLGYRIDRVIPRYYPDGEDAYLMIKDDCS